MSQAWPFLGRTHELETLLATLSESSAALLGPAGIGKSRLAAAATDVLQSRGVVVRRIVGISSARSIPLMALRPLIGDAGTGDLVGPIHAALQLTNAAPGPGDPVIVVEDAALLDDASAAVIQQVHAAGRVRLLLTMRTDDITGSPVIPLLRNETIRTLTLLSMTDETAEQVVSAALGGDVDGHSLRRFVDAAQGNPMLLRELIIGARSSGTLRERHGLWSLDGRLPATAVLKDLVAERVIRLNEAEFRALELLVVGGILRLDLMIEASSVDTVESLERGGLLQVTSGTPAMVDTAHPLYREVLGGRLGALARLRCHRQLAELSVRLGYDLPNDVLQGAVWQLLGGVALDAGEALAAARIASNRKDPELSAELALASYRASPEASAAILAAWSLAATGRQQQAAELVKDALTKVTDPAGRAALALRQAEDLWWWARNQAAALAALDAAVTELGPGEWADMLRVQPSVFSAMNGDGRKAVELALLFAEHDVLRVRLVAAIGLGFGLVLCDRGSEAIDIADKAFADALTDPTHELSGDPTIHIVCRLFAGLYGPNAEETLELATSIYAVAVQQPSQQSRAWAALLLGLAHFAHGHPISAARFCTEAELLWSDCAIQGLARWSASATVLAHLSLGDPTAARETFDRMSTYDQTGFAFNASFEDRAAAHFAVRDGRTDDATDILVAAAQREAARGTHILASDCLYELCRLGRSDVAAEYTHLLSDNPGTLTQARIELIRAAVNDDPMSLERAANRFGEMGRQLEASECWFLAADAHRRNGDAKGSSAAATQAKRIAQHCEGAQLTTADEQKSVPILSSREYEVATLAASGQSNRQIADRLVVSERTVESHLYRVFAKLGVTTRDRLGPELERHF